MDEHGSASTRSRALLVAAALLAAFGAAFWAWRENAPLARFYRAERRRRGADQAPNPEENPGTDPV